MIRCYFCYVAHSPEYWRKLGLRRRGSVIFVCAALLKNSVGTRSLKNDPWKNDDDKVRRPQGRLRGQCWSEKAFYQGKWTPWGPCSPSLRLFRQHEQFYVTTTDLCCSVPRLSLSHQCLRVYVVSYCPVLPVIIQRNKFLIPLSTLLPSHFLLQSPMYPT